jgi:hypothetical protein
MLHPKTILERRGATAVLHSAWKSLLGLAITLTFTGGAQAAPGVSFNASRLDYGNQLVGVRSAAQALTITNSGSSPLTISSVSFTGANPGDFLIGSDSGEGTLAPGASRLVGIQCRPLAVGGRSAVLAVSDNAAGSPQLVSLAGNGVTTFVYRSPRSIDFGNVLVQQTSGPQTITIRNDGNTALTITDITTAYTNNPLAFRFGGDVSVSNYPASQSPLHLVVPPGGSLSLLVSFQPEGPWRYPSTLYIYDTAPSSPHLVTLAGTGVLPPVPAAPTNLTAWVTDTEFPIHLSWSGNAGPNGWFEFDRQMNNWGWGTGGPYGLGGRRVVGTTANTELGRWNQWEVNAIYSFRVRAANVAGASAWSNVVTVDLRIPPTPPSDLTALGASDRITLSWTNRSYDLDSFEVWRKRAGADWILIKSVNAVTSVTNYGMTSGVLYTYRVRAARAGIYSAWSNEASAIRTAGP